MKTLIKALRVSKSDAWLRVADDLEKPTRQRREVNLSRLERVTSSDEVIVVPGKVLGSGVLSHSVTIAAWSFSDGARKRIEIAKGTCLSISQLLKKQPDAKNVRIIG